MALKTLSRNFGRTATRPLSTFDTISKNPARVATSSMAAIDGPLPGQAFTSSSTALTERGGNDHFGTAAAGNAFSTGAKTPGAPS